METFSELLAIRAGSYWPVTRSFDVSFDLFDLFVRMAIRDAFAPIVMWLWCLSSI